MLQITLPPTPPTFTSKTEYQPAGSIQEAMDKLLQNTAVQSLLKRNQELEAAITVVQGDANAVLEELRFLRRLGRAALAWQSPTDQPDSMTDPVGFLKREAELIVPLAEIIREGKAKGYLR